ncbi:hypothetical protein E5288_WYG007173 [Bos mutus]|uniref:Low-density lipoprotein receptor class A domain-containing protein 4 n=1 Tax=Bos mutus TaxID=72004 RepID=A0A6B0QQ52_9CETA|nr:hypothetical protein [Bos mutus]
MPELLMELCPLGLWVNVYIAYTPESFAILTFDEQAKCKFTCTSGQCLYLGSLVCNQQNDCGDNSDEENCLLVTEHPPPGIFSSIPFIEKKKALIQDVKDRYTEWLSCALDDMGIATMYAPRCRDGVTAPPFLQRDRFSRFQPTYPYVQHEIDLPPTISLSDGEEPPPYQGPCTLQLRDPEQQMELNRESVRAPPNRTVFDSDLIGVSVYSGGPCPPSSNSGISASTCSSTGRMAGPPPAYSEAMGHYPAATPSHPQHSSAHRGSRLLLQREGPGARSCPTRARTGSPGSASDL